MRQAGQCRNAIDGSIEYKFRPLRRPRILQRFRLQSARDDQVACFLDDGERCGTWLKRSQPRRGVQFILHKRVAVPRAAHKRGAANDMPARVLSDDFLATQAILRGNYSPVVEAMSGRCDRFLHLGCFCRYDREIALGNFCRARSGLKRNTKIVFPAHTQSVAIQRARMFFTAHEGPNLNDARKMRGVKRTDGATTDDADALHVRAALSPFSIWTSIPAW